MDKTVSATPYGPFPPILTGALGVLERVVKETKVGLPNEAEAALHYVKEALSEREERVPDFEEDFEGAVEAICDQVVDDLKKHPEPEYWIAKSAARLAHFVKIKAPSFIIEGEKRLLQCRVTALPVYCADYDALKSEAGGG